MVMQRAVREARARIEQNRFGESEALEQKVKSMTRHFLKTAEKEPKLKSRPSWGNVMKKTSDPVFMAPGWIKESVVIESMAARIFSLQTRLENEQRKSERLMNLQTMVGDPKEHSFKPKKQSVASYASDRRNAFNTSQAFFQAWKTVCLQSKLKSKEDQIGEASRRAKKFEEDCYWFDFTDKWANKIDSILRTQRGGEQELMMFDEGGERTRGREQYMWSWLKEAPVLSLPIKLPDSIVVRTANPTHEFCRVRTMLIYLQSEGFTFVVRADSHSVILTELKLASSSSSSFSFSASQRSKIMIKASKVSPADNSTPSSLSSFSPLSIDASSCLPAFNLLDDEPSYGSILIRQGVKIPARSQRTIFVGSSSGCFAVRGNKKPWEVVDRDAKGFVDILPGKAIDVDESKAIKLGMREKVVCFCGELVFKFDVSS
ncbi:hypothetical protein GUITHDRAFT_109869 [Guillardia theta CCMP2712]|uniref:Uncharacterized protein n=1 Tax=Guillardia theta (strain CCMP2712) TaxID=905079 RepID=L1J6D9_GUITC|nr:hypothetical protein GUITHDRAFT_109869 [Guillardia theta CCMP2712]EKX44086.1 hypothetical protein GUITHDRAFT_109869 [Guillardia theta CCMP2712]|eukprot:XP_005831066.1 hypothetical protein GUITHDRAFT_109869 [Guillardia theta CCMP2712]